MVPVQVQNCDPAPWLEDTPRFRQRPLRMLRVVQRLAQKRQAHRARTNRNIFDVAQPVLQFPIPFLGIVQGITFFARRPHWRQTSRKCADLKPA